MSKLVIVESPAKAKTIGKYLGKDYEVTASMGHIRDLPASQLGIDVEHDYTPQYISIKGKEKLIKELKSKAKHSDGVLLATDPDREGEAISWHLANILGLDPHEPNRVTFDEITKKGVQEGMAHPRAIDEDLFNAQQARRVLDRLVGYKLSPFLWRKVRRGLSAGRVQSVAVRLIDDREKEIESFKPEEYWNVDATLGVGHKSFTARLASDDKGKKLLPRTEAEARAIEQGLEGAEYTVGELKKGKRAKQPTPAFITSTLQQEASRRLGFTATRTMRAAQTLYEGVDIAGHGTMGLITYMRTDSLRISDEAVAAAKEYIAGAYGEQYICPYKRTWKTKSATAAQDAHEAIRPSVPGLTPDEVDKSISGDTAKLYRMIWSRFMASQMADCQQDTVSVTVYAGGYRFKASGYTVTFDGFTALYEEATDEKEKKETSLPPLEQGQVLKLRELKSEQKFTQPPARYTEATLIKALEENGIGRPSTYAPTVSTILDREYVVKEGKALRITPLGQVVTDLMCQRFPDIVDVKFTARMEKKLDDVESGDVQWKDVIRQFYVPFHENLEQVEKDMEGVYLKVPDEVVSFTDGCMGPHSENLLRDCGDFYLRRADGVFAYQLAVVVDDARMGVTEVVRGADLLSSTARQLYLYRLLGLKAPRFAHCPLLLAPDGRRLSKRDGDQSLENLRARYTAAEIVGKLAYAYGLQEEPAPRTPESLTADFSWEKVPKHDICLPEDLF